MVTGNDYHTSFPFRLDTYTGDIVYSNGSCSVIVLPELPSKVVIGNVTLVPEEFNGVYNGIILVKVPIPEVSSIGVYVDGQLETVKVVYQPYIPNLPYSEVFVEK